MYTYTTFLTCVALISFGSNYVILHISFLTPIFSDTWPFRCSLFNGTHLLFHMFLAYIDIRSRTCVRFCTFKPCHYVLYSVCCCRSRILTSSFLHHNSKSFWIFHAIGVTYITGLVRLLVLFLTVFQLYSVSFLRGLVSTFYCSTSFLSSQVSILHFSPGVQRIRFLFFFRLKPKIVLILCFSLYGQYLTCDTKIQLPSPAFHKFNNPYNSSGWGYKNTS